MVDDRRDQILRKIEFAFMEVLRQLSTFQLRRIVLRTCVEESEKQLEFGHRYGAKLAFNVCTLSQIFVMIADNRFATKRDLYYDLKSLYRNQGNLDRSISAICELLNEQRIDLNVLSCSKGIMSGSLCFVTADRTIIDCRAQPVLISEALMDFQLINEANFVLVVEKDASFQKLTDEGFFEIYPNSILVTGKGYPDICTRKVLRWMIAQLRIPIFGLFDADPHGFEIMLTYKYGSSTERAEGRGAYIRNLQWIGMRPSDAKIFPIAADQHLPLLSRDYMKVTRIRRRATGLDEQQLVDELDVMRTAKTKLELEAITSIGRQFMTRGLILPRVNAALATTG